MIETICRDCGTRYQLGLDHTCPKRPAKKRDNPASFSVATQESGFETPPHPEAPKKSTAARKDVHVWKPSGRANVVVSRSAASDGNEREAATTTPAGTQAPPVDTPKRGRGRPPGAVPFDKKAHDRKMSAERRARAKEGK